MIRPDIHIVRRFFDLDNHDNCTPECPMRYEIMVGSVACKECKDNLGYVEGNYWVDCTRIKR